MSYRVFALHNAEDAKLAAWRGSAVMPSWDAGVCLTPHVLKAPFSGVLLKPAVKLLPIDRRQLVADRFDHVPSAVRVSPAIGRFGVVEISVHLSNLFVGDSLWLCNQDWTIREDAVLPKVTARFYRVSPKPDQAPDFPNLLLSQMASPREQRERDVTGKGAILRVEDCTEDGDFVSGQFCRKQVAEIPPQAGPEGLATLSMPSGHGLGHVAAFRYHRPTRVILLQSNIQCATPKRVCLYAAALNSAAVYSFSIVQRVDALQRLQGRKVRSMTVQFASTQHLEALDRQGVAVAQGARLLAQAFHGFDLTIKVGVGRSRKKFLDFGSVSRDVNALVESEADLEKLIVAADADPSGRGIDFLEENLYCRDDMDLPDDDHDTHYIKRKEYLRVKFNTHLPYLTSHFGPAT